MENVLPFRKPEVEEPGPLAERFLRSVQPEFFIGIAATFGLPWVISSSYFGLLLAILLGVCALAGALWGIIKFWRFPYRIITCVPGEMSQAPALPDIRVHLAA